MVKGMSRCDPCPHRFALRILAVAGVVALVEFLALVFLWAR